MKSEWTAVIGICAALAMTAPAMAADPAAAPGGYAVPVDQSEIHFTHDVGSGAPDGPDGPDGMDEIDSRARLMISNWVPRGLRAYSYQGLTQSFSRGELPYLSAVYLFSPLKNGAWRDVSFRAGIGYLQLGRDANLVEDGGVAESARQSVHLMTLDLGAEWSPSVARWKALAPYLGAGLLPSVAFTTRSDFDGGTSSFGLPVGISAGVNLKLPYFGASVGAPRAELNLGALSTLGSISGSDAFSVGLQVGFGLEI